MEVNGQLEALAAVTPGSNPGTRGMGDWVVPRASLRLLEKRMKALNWICLDQKLDCYYKEKKLWAKINYLMWIFSQDRGTRLRSWLRHRATSRKVAGSIPAGGHWIPMWGKGGRCVWWQPFQFHAQIFFSRDPQLPGALRVCAGIAYCVMITYLFVAIASLEIDLDTAERHEQQTSAR